MQVKFKTIGDVKHPTIGTTGSAGVDFYVPDNFPSRLLQPGESINIPSCIKVKIPDNTVFIAFNKSSQALNGLQVGACVVDSDYIGEVHLHVTNISNDSVIIPAGAKLVQFILLPYKKPELSLTEEDFEETERGEGAFGSTGLE